MCERHYFKYFPVRIKSVNNFHSIQEATTLDYIEKSMPIISAILENMQADHQTSMVEIEGMLKDKPISILTNPFLIYVSLRIV